MEHQEEFSNRENSRAESLDIGILQDIYRRLEQTGGRGKMPLQDYARRWAAALQGSDSVKWAQTVAMMKASRQWAEAVDGGRFEGMTDDDIAIELFSERVVWVRQQMIGDAVRACRDRVYDTPEQRTSDIVGIYEDTVKDYFSSDVYKVQDRFAGARLKNLCVGVLQAHGRGSQIVMETVVRQRTEPLFDEAAKGALASMAAVYGVDIVEVSSSDDIPKINVRDKVKGTYVSEGGQCVGPFSIHMDDDGTKLYLFPENVLNRLSRQSVAMEVVKGVVARKGLRGLFSSEALYRKALSQIYEILPPSCIEAARANILESAPEKADIAEKFLEVSHSPALFLPDRVMDHVKVDVVTAVMEAVNREVASGGADLVLRTPPSSPEVSTLWSCMEHHWREGRRLQMERSYAAMTEAVDSAIRCYRKTGSPYVIVPLGVCSQPMIEAGMHNNPLDIQARYLDNSLNACGLSLDAAASPSFLRAIHDPLFIFRNGRLTKEQIKQKSLKSNNMSDRERMVLEKEYRKVYDRPVVITALHTPSQEEGGISRYLSFILPSNEELRSGARVSMEKVFSSSMSNIANRFSKIIERQERNPLKEASDLLYCCDPDRAEYALDRIDRYYLTDYECHGRWMEEKNRSDARGINLPVTPSPAVPCALHWERKSVANVVNKYFENKRFGQRFKPGLTEFDKSFSLGLSGDEQFCHIYRPGKQVNRAVAEKAPETRHIPVKMPQRRISTSRKLETGDCSDRLLNKLYNAGVYDAVALYARRDNLAMSLSETERKAVDAMLLAKGVGNVRFDAELERESNLAYRKYINTGELLPYELSRKISMCKDALPEGSFASRLKSLILGTATLTSERERCAAEYMAKEQRRLNGILSGSDAPFCEVVSFDVLNPPFTEGPVKCDWMCKGVSEVTLRCHDGSVVKASSAGGDLLLQGGWKVSLADGTTYDLNKGVYNKDRKRKEGVKQVSVRTRKAPGRKPNGPR